MEQIQPGKNIQALMLTLVALAAIIQCVSINRMCDSGGQGESRFTHQPCNLTVLENETAITLNCSQNNGSVSTHTAIWIVNGSAPTQQERDLYYTYHHNNSLTIRSSVAMFNNTSFQCWLNTYHSNVGYLTVVSPYHPDIFFSRQPITETVFIGDIVTFYCSASSVTMAVVAVWVINGTTYLHTDFAAKREYTFNHDNSLSVIAEMDLNGTSFQCILDPVRSNIGYLYLNSTTQLISNTPTEYSTSEVTYSNATSSTVERTTTDGDVKNSDETPGSKSNVSVAVIVVLTVIPLCIIIVTVLLVLIIKVYKWRKKKIRPPAPDNRLQDPNNL